MRKTGMDDIFAPLPRLEVIKAIERRNPCRIPLVMAKWWGEGFESLHGAALKPFEKYPEDAAMMLIEPFDYANMGLPWEIDQAGAYDRRCVLDDWAKLDDFIARLPDPRHDPQFERAAEAAEKAHAEDRYFLFGWWRLFFERPWEIRGMLTLLTDYIKFPEQVLKLNDALCGTYLAYLQFALRNFSFDGFWTSDDLGHQKQLFMSPQTFRHFLKPGYERIGSLLKQHAIHWWLHSCGNNTLVMGDLADAGVTVFHPVQKHTMDERLIATEYGERMSFLAGFDVQQTLRTASPAEVRREVRFLVDTFDRPEGGLCLAAGNGILPGTPLENVDAFLDEALVYGALKRSL
jgi:uroporphyrinogen decarboxylase